MQQAREDARNYKHAAEMTDAAACNCKRQFEQLTFVNSQVSGIGICSCTNKYVARLLMPSDDLVSVHTA